MDVVASGVSMDQVAELSIKKVFNGKFDDKSWMSWLTEKPRTGSISRILPIEKVICLTRYGNRSVTIWQWRDQKRQAVCSFIPALYGLGKNPYVAATACMAEAKLGGQECLHMRQPRLVTGFLQGQVPDLDVLDLPNLSRIAGSSEPKKLDWMYQSIIKNKVGEFVFIPNELLPEEFVLGDDNPQCYDFDGLLDDEGNFITQFGFQHQLNKLGLGYNLAKKSKVIKKSGE
jgi:hypothetical protein